MYIRIPILSIYLYLQIYYLTDRTMAIKQVNRVHILRNGFEIWGPTATSISSTYYLRFEKEMVLYAVDYITFP